MDGLEITGPQSVSSRRVRADAARNREKVLAAAARLFREKGVAAVSMDAVAAEAGVGKGTIFRAFGDKSGLAVALLDTQETLLQEGVLSGPPPLGPGAPARERLGAFFDAYLDYLFGHLDLVRMSETASPGARYRIGAYRFWHRHVTVLLEEGGPRADAAVLAHLLLAGVSGELAGVLDEEYGRERVRAAITALVEALV
ncbi:TetR/AcrR family transcriptional regulator [Nonomuraea soli]|uniref:AcrR family transcriptional regulator n=1 Tax=Nonomuraea soli TaxID=1032476 RepID=A0A7W0CDS5_9ACTN|nr:helix-turn-helix domain-containing protein [Nonomuraea soli]MBA2889296.1 AcrR family transcriptional regulator [Nonomuraea soli]